MKESVGLNKGESAAVWIEVEKLYPWKDNPRQNDHAVPHVMKSIKRFGFAAPIIARPNGEIIAGHTRWKAASEMGLKKVPVRYMDLDPVEAQMLALADNKLNELADWDEAILSEVLTELHMNDEDIVSLGFSGEELSNLIEDYDNFSGDDDSFDRNVEGIPLTEQFIIPPLTTLDARKGYWQKRKSQWLSLGIKSEIGRKGKMVGGFADASRKMDMMKGSPSGGRNPGYLDGTSIFDPVLCEIVYRWFGFPQARVLDPFAGGSVRGIVANKLDLEYIGIELREEQVESNIDQSHVICDNHYGEKGRLIHPEPTWITGNSLNIDTLINGKFDLIFSCPPYYDLEKYSDDPEDISNHSTYEKFLEDYRTIINKSVSKLKDNRFAIFVVGDVRCRKTGKYRNFVSDTIGCFIDAGMVLYNEAILLTIYASMIMRVGKQMRASRKLGKTHQNVLIFYKGDTSKISEHLGVLDISQFGDVEIDD